jgi:SAM-dependent methyltransferase
MTATETVPCPLCGEAEARLLFQGPGFAMVRCRCGLVRQSPRTPAPAMLAGHYDGAVRGYESFVSRPGRAADLEAWQTQPLRAYERGVEAIERARLRTGERGVWLDVGASSGAMLVAARNAGWQVAGVEPGRKQVEICEAEHGIRLFHGTLAAARFPDGFAEVISWRQVLEHVHDPVAELTEARRVLAPDGLLLIEVPNFAGLRYRWGRLRTALRLSSPFWLRVNVPEHLYYYTIESLGRLLEKAGFEVASWRTYGKTRRRTGPLRRLVDAVRDGLRVGNKLRVVAGRRAPTAAA